MKIYKLLTILFVLFSLNCDSEPKPVANPLPREIFNAVDAFYKRENNNDAVLNAVGYKYNDEKFLVFSTHYKEPNRKNEDLVFNEEEIPLVVKKNGASWEVVNVAGGAFVQKANGIDLRKYKYCENAKSGSKAFQCNY